MNKIMAMPETTAVIDEATEGHLADTKPVEARESLDFWPTAVMTLEVHEEKTLHTIVNGIAEIAPNVDQGVIANVLPYLESAYYDKRRKYTNEPEINHAYHVGILVAHAVGVENLTTEQFIAALGHDYYENTNRSLSDIEPPRNPQMVSDTIVALSHKRNGQRIYQRHEKGQYFRAMVQNYREYPEVDVPLIKVCDQIAVANGPLTVDELKTPSSVLLINKWNDMSERKIGEMKKFSGVLQEAGLGDSQAARLLEQAIPFTQLRVRGVKEKPREIPLLRR